MNYRFSRHAREEMQRRSLAEGLIDSVLQNPQQIIEERAGRKAYQSQVDFGGKVFLLRVIVVDDVEPAVVVTAYRTSRITTYWRP